MSELDTPAQPPAAQPSAAPGQGLNPHPIRLVVADDLHFVRMSARWCFELGDHVWLTRIRYVDN